MCTLVIELSSTKLKPWSRQSAASGLVQIGLESSFGFCSRMLLKAKSRSSMLLAAVKLPGGLVRLPQPEPKAIFCMVSKSLLEAPWAEVSPMANRVILAIRNWSASPPERHRSFCAASLALRASAGLRRSTPGA